MLNIESLLDRSVGPPLLLPPALHAFYGGDFYMPTPAAGRLNVAVNFVTTLDGVASFQIPGRSGGGEISRFDEGDRFIMALLRSTTDAVVFGSGSLTGDPGHVRIAEFVCPGQQEAFRVLRQEVLGKSVHPLNVVVTASGIIDLREPTFHTPDLKTLIVTTPSGLERLMRDHGTGLEVTQVRTVANHGEGVPPASTLAILRDEFGVRQLLHEGGPRLFGSFLAAGLVDELFLTVAPQIAGRSTSTPRPGIVDGCAFAPDAVPLFELIGVRMRQDYLYYRYRRNIKPHV